MNSRLISRPTTRKKTVSSPSSIQSRKDNGEAEIVERQSETLVPERRKARAQRRVGDDHGEDRRQQQEDARGRAPAHEVERRRADPVAEPAEHRVGEGAFVPGPVVAAAVDEEGRRDQSAARSRARLVRVHPRPRPGEGLFVGRIAFRPPRRGRSPRPKILRRQDLRPRHQLDVGVPKLLRTVRALDELSRPSGELDADQRPMAEDVAQPVAELIANLSDALVGRPAIGQGSIRPG